MDSIVYEDRPHYDTWLKAILAFPLAIVLVPGLYAFSDGDTETALGMFVTAAVVAVVFWAILPRRYLVLDSKVKIVMGGPFSFTIPFDTIESARTPEGTTFGINFVTSFSSNNAVVIDRKRRMNVNITPDSRELFLDNMDKALTEWRSRSTGDG